MHLYEVGQLYNPKRTSWPECAQFNYRGGEYELVLFYNQPAADEVRDIRSALSQFALVVIDRMIFLLYKFGLGQWSDAPYSWWMVPPDQRTIPNHEPGSEERILLQIILVDAATGIIKVLRAVSFSPAFSQALNQAVRDQATSEFDADAAIRQAYQCYPDSRDMLKAAIATTNGGR